MDQARHRVFGIGWHKTGTTSLGRALARLGYSVPQLSGRTFTDLILRWHEGNVAKILKFAELGDGFEDFPWPLIYRDLDRAFPDAKFILTTRRNDAIWLHSLQKHALRMPRWVGHYLIYGSYDLNSDSEVFVARYRDHNRSVRRYFAGRRGKLLELCFEQGDGWAPLCHFLGVEDIPNEPFPHLNSARNPHEDERRQFAGSASLIRS